MKHTRTDPPTVLVAIDLAYQNGRDYYAGILRHLDTARRRWNIHLVRHGLTRDVLTRERMAGIDGVMFDYTASDDVIPLLADQTLPCVALDCARPDLFGERKRNLAFVDIDSDAIGRRAAEFLSAQGRYATFGAIGYEAACNWSERRIRSFEGKIAAGAGETRTLRIRRADIGNPTTREAVRDWIANLPRPTAVMAVCDELARLLTDIVTAAGVRVPQEIAVLGVDNEWILCTHMRPTLSSIHPDFERSGFLAAECMDRFIRRGAGRAANVSAAPRSGTPLRRISPVKGIVERESTAPSSPAGQMVARAEEFIRDHADENLHVEDVVRHLKVSRRLLFLRFRQITGHTVLDAIRTAQLERVRTLLRTTTLSITEICRLCRFRSENHLKRLFKQAFGQTMSDYRNA